MKSSQVGATEVINNIVGYSIDQDPSPILLVQPTKEMGEAWSKDRLAPMLRDTPCLQNKVSDVKSRDRNNTLLHKKFYGGHITIAGANAPAGLASRPIRRLLFDETDRFPLSAGSEGDPISLGRKRTTTFWNRLIVNVSSPTTAGISRIEKCFELSDKRYFYVECPHCNEFHRLEWKHIVWEKTEDGAHLPDTAAHVCSHCGALETDADLPGMLAAGEWRKHAPKVTGHAGFHINELYSPWVKFSDTVKDHLKSKNDPEQLKVWVNTALGEVWNPGKNTEKSENMLARRENYDSTLLPFGAVAITVGVDVQDNRLELETIAWGMDYESWSLEYNVFNGDTAKPDVWKILDTYLTKQFVHESGLKLRIMSCGIDTGGHNTAVVYDFCRSRYKRGVFALKGSSTPNAELTRGSTKKNKGKVNLFVIGTNAAKDIFSSFLTQKEHGPGYCHFPHNYGKIYFNQLLSEWPILKKGSRSWQLKKSGLRNEALDCRIYAFVALKILGIDLNVVVERFMSHVGTNPTVERAVSQAAVSTQKRSRMRSHGYGAYRRTG